MRTGSARFLYPLGILLQFKKRNVAFRGNLQLAYKLHNIPEHFGLDRGQNLRNRLFIISINVKIFTLFLTKKIFETCLRLSYEGRSKMSGRFRTGRIEDNHFLDKLTQLTLLIRLMSIFIARGGGLFGRFVETSHAPCCLIASKTTCPELDQAWVRPDIQFSHSGSISADRSQNRLYRYRYPVHVHRNLILGLCLFGQALKQHTIFYTSTTRRGLRKNLNFHLG